MSFRASLAAEEGGDLNAPIFKSSNAWGDTEASIWSMNNTVVGLSDWRLTGWLPNRQTDCPDWRLTGWMTRLSDWLTHWLTDRLVVARLADLLTDRPTDRPTDRLAGHLTNWPTVGPTDWLTDWPTGWLTDWLTDPLTYQLKDWLVRLLPYLQTWTDFRLRDQ